MKTPNTYRTSIHGLVACMAAVAWLAAASAQAAGAAAQAVPVATVQLRMAEEPAPAAQPASAATAAPARHAAVTPSCPKCRRAASGGDVVMFWLLFGGVAKSGAPDDDTPTPSDGTTTQ